MAGIKQLKAWFFQITSEARADGTVGGIRLRKTDKPTQQTFENLLASATFSTETNDKAKVSTGATLGSEQGLVVLSNNTQAKANATQLADRSLVTQPHQLPTVEPLANAAIEDMPTTVMETTAEVAVTTRNNYQVRPVVGWVTWLVSRLFKQGGVEGDVPIKTSGTDYAWQYQNPGNNTTIVNAIAGNANFVNTLLANNTFVDNLTTQIITNNPAAITEALEVGFMRVHPVAAMPTAKWLRCDGSAIDRTTYAALYNLLTINGTVPAPYGTGDGSTTFNLPDFRDKQITGYSGTKAIGSTAGQETRTIAEANLPSHSHTLSGSTGGPSSISHTHHQTVLLASGVGVGWGGAFDPSANTTLFDTGDIATDGGLGTHTHTLSGNTSSVGSGTALDTLDPYLATNIIIKVLP